MSVYRVHFTWKEKEYILKATHLDITHPYYVCIKDLLLPQESGYLINPADDEVRKLFSGVRQLMLPFQSVSLIEEYPEDPAPRKGPSESPTGKIITSTFNKKG
ncbi:MAG: DUF1820 family protein [Desulfopila sp.]